MALSLQKVYYSTEPLLPYYTGAIWKKVKKDVYNISFFKLPSSVVLYIFIAVQEEFKREIFPITKNNL